MAAFKGMHVSPAKHSYWGLPRKWDYQTDRQTDRQTDTRTDRPGQSDPYVLLCFTGDTKTFILPSLEKPYITHYISYIKFVFLKTYVNVCFSKCLFSCYLTYVWWTEVYHLYVYHALNVCLKCVPFWGKVFCQKVNHTPPHHQTHAFTQC